MARVYVCVVVVLVLAWHACADTVLRVRKCCPLHQQLANLTRCADFDYERYDADARRRRRDAPPWWLSHRVDLLDAATRAGLARDAVTVLAEPDAPQPCDATLASPLLEPDEYAILADGRLLLNTGVKVLVFPRTSYCADLLLVEDRERHAVLLCPCDHAPCVRKCCFPGSALSVVRSDARSENASCSAQGDPGDEWTPALYDAPGGDVVNGSGHVTLYGFPQCGASELLTSRTRPDFQLLRDGRASAAGLAPLSVSDYCADGDVLLTCRSAPAPATLYGSLGLVGAVFLLATALLHACLPELTSRVHGKTVAAHSASLCVSFVFLAATQLHPGLPQPFCSVAAYIIQMSFLAAFFWLNVMCIDISWAFSGLRPPQGSAAERDRKKFFMYSAYAWGGTAAIAAVTLIVEYSPAVSVTSRLKPNIGETRCWFKDNMSVLLYFYGPMAVLLLGNLVLFSYTACRIVTVRRETVILDMNDSRRHEGNTATTYKRDRQRLALYGKLFTLMGLTWVTEILSFAVGGPMYYWYLTDCVNILRAVYIFYIFCCKRSVLKLIRMRLPSFCPCAMKPASNRPLGGSSGQQTASIRLSDKRKQSTKSEEGEQETRA